MVRSRAGSIALRCPGVEPHDLLRLYDSAELQQRVRCMIDLLLTCSTISEARDKTTERLGRDAEDMTDEGR